jgi:hypothetical protein
MMTMMITTTHCIIIQVYSLAPQAALGPLSLSPAGRGQAATDSLKLADFSLPHDEVIFTLWSIFFIFVHVSSLCLFAGYFHCT